ncbi:MULTISPECIES: Ig-like domain-containing protein [unclassified Serratia (in: enterobacteria)]|uniref:Ig-like domain-containing protein n=1 Tax=unclassified Serratia (in: enterobacteria) TaxID=2647522 RepID=UPI00137792A1|nr:MULTISPECIES: Ig-like domain-containing protein [unclassified Serratia (in: enterobacteria)]
MSLEGDSLEQPTVIIEDFFLNDAQLIGMAEDGAYYPYISSNGDDDNAIAAILLDGESSPLVLGGEALSSSESHSILGALGILALGLGAIGAMVSQGRPGKHSGGGNHEEQPVVPDVVLPTLNQVIDNKGALQGIITAGSETDDNTPTFSGSNGTPGNTIIFYDNGKKLGETTVGQDGRWSFTPGESLDEGSHSITLVEQNANGKTSTPSDAFEFVVDTLAPAAPTIVSILDDVGSETGALKSGATTDDTQPTLTGKAEAGAKIEIYDNGKKIGETTADTEGNWVFTPKNELAEGKHSFTSRAYDAAGNISVFSQPWEVLIDTTAPNKPSIDGNGPGIGEIIDDQGAVQGPITNGGATDDTQPTLSGKGEPGDTIIITDNGNKIGETTVDENGNWEFTPENKLDEGEHEIRVIIEDLAGNKSEPSDPWVVIVDTTPPAAPSIGSVYDDAGNQTGELQPGAATDDTTPTLKGQAEAGTNVEIFDKGTKIGETTAGADGKWEFTPKSELAEGEHSFTTRATDAAGNASELSEPWVVIVDSTPPTAPSIGSVYDNAGSKTGAIQPGEVIDDSRPVIGGKAEAGSKVEIYDNGTKIGETTTDEAGNWSFKPDSVLELGNHAITVKAVDAVGNVSEPSSAFDFSLITPNAPSAPAIVAVLDDVGSIQGPLQKDAVTDDTRPTLVGTSEPGTTVSIYNNGELLGSVATDAEGQWRFTPESDLPEGENKLSAIAKDKDGNISPQTGDYIVVIDTTAPAPIESGELMDDVGKIQGAITNGTVTDDAQPTFSGKAEVGSTVVIFDQGKEIGRVVTDSKGDWHFTPDTALTDGEHSLTAQVIDRAGNESEVSEAITFNVDTRLVEVSIDSVQDDFGVKQGPIAMNGVTDDATPTFSGRALPDSTVVIYDKGVELGSVTSDASGNWSFTPQTPMAEGNHAITATVITAGAGESTATPVFDFNIDVTKPSKPGNDGETGIGTVIDDVGSVQGPIANGGTTDDTTPTFNGKGEPGDTIHIFDKGVLLGSVEVKTDGNWTFTPPSLTEGKHDITLVIEDPAGNQSEPSDPWVVIVDTTPPAVPSIGSIYDDVGSKTGELQPGAETDDTTPTLKGLAEAGAKVEIFDKGTKIGETTAKEDGSWEFTPESELAEGKHSFTIRATDVAGNVSGLSQPWALVIDTTAPNKPSIDGNGAGISEVLDDQGTVTGPISNGGTTDDTKPTLNGKGEPGDTIIITDNGNKIGEVIVDKDGKWEFTPETDLSEGEHKISVIIQDPAGNQSKPSDPWVVIVDTTPPATPSIDSIYDDAGSKTGELQSGATTDDTTPTLKGQAEAGAKVEIFDNGTKIGETTAKEDGSWEFTPENELAEGDHSFTIRATDVAGNVSGLSQPWELVIGTTPIAEPSKPVIEAVIDDVGSVTGELVSGAVTDDRQPEISGRSDAYATVIVYDRGVEIGRTQANKDGVWSFMPENDLQDGTYNFTAVAKNDVGSKSVTSDPFELIVYTGNGPTQFARVSQMGKDSGYDGNDFVSDNGNAGRLMHGTLSAELAAGQTLQVSTDGGKNWFDALVDGTKWAAQDLNEHGTSWNIQTRVMDQFGKTGAVMSQAVTLDVTALQAPAAVSLEGTNLRVELGLMNVANVVVGERIAVVADGGAHRFEHTLTAQDIAAGSVTLDVGTVNNASVALVDLAGNLSGFTTTSGSAPGVNMTVTGDVSEIYGQNRDNIFTVDDVNVLNNVKVIEGNGGVDTLKLTGADQVLDLSTWSGRLSSVEVIDITGSGNNTLKLSLGDVLDQGFRGAFINDESVQLAVKGNAGDVVMLNDLLPNGMDVGDWENLGEVVSAGISYEVYHHTGMEAEILIQQGVDVQFH